MLNPNIGIHAKALISHHNKWFQSIGLAMGYNNPMKINKFNE
ncbi:hypothetical protein [Shewanella sp. SR44-3]|nr:hypothetical protein [Shewanella sp. SR44-3]